MNALKSIRVEDFAHPEEKAALAAMNKAKWLRLALDWISSQQNLYMLKTQVLGNCINITEEDMPKLYRLTKEVCEVLDYSMMPRLYIFRSPSFKLGVYAGDPPLIVIPDFVVNELEHEMLRFQIGRAVTALKADTCQLKMLVAALKGAASLFPGIGDAATALLADWARKADLTEDRGGLLACQNVETAERTLMRMAGMPLQYLDSSHIVPYIQTCQNNPKLALASKYVRTIARTENWNNARIIELYQWYCSGQYDDLIEEYE